MKLFKKKEAKGSEVDKVEARREEVLSQGRKFKYPLQWTKHRIITNTILIILVIVAMILIGGWLALYRIGMTDDLLFKVTEIVPAPVAKVDGEDTRFSDYLMFYRSSMTSIERQSGSQFDDESVKDLRNEYKRSALDKAERHTFAGKLAKEQNITVTDEEITNEFERHLKIGGIERSEESFLKIVKDNFGLDKTEYQRMLYLSLLKSKVEVAIDEKANKIVSKIEKLLASNENDFGKVSEELGEQISYEETGGLVDSKNIDGGRAAEAMKLEPGQSSGKFISMNGDGYYFVKLIKKTDSEVNFVSIKVPFTELEKRFSALKDEGKINEFIEIKGPEDETQPEQQ